MRNTRLGLTLLAGLMASTQAAAVYTEGYDIPYFSGLYAYESSDSAREAEDGNGYQLSIGIPLSPKTSFELTFYDVGRERALDGNKDYQTALFLDWTRDLGTFGWESSASLPRFKPFGIIAHALRCQRGPGSAVPPDQHQGLGDPHGSARADSPEQRRIRGGRRSADGLSRDGRSPDSPNALLQQGRRQGRGLRTGRGRCRIRP